MQCLLDISQYGFLVSSHTDNQTEKVVLLWLLDAPDFEYCIRRHLEK